MTSSRALPESQGRLPSSESDKAWGMLAHLCTLCGIAIPLGNFLAPLVVAWLGRKSAYVLYHARTAVNFQLTVILHYVVFASVSGVILLWGDEEISGSSRYLYLFLLVTAILYLLTLFFGSVSLVLVAASRARAGICWRYPLSMNFWKGPRFPEPGEGSETTP